MRAAFPRRAPRLHSCQQTNRRRIQWHVHDPDRPSPCCLACLAGMVFVLAVSSSRTRADEAGVPGDRAAIQGRARQSAAQSAHHELPAVRRRRGGCTALVEQVPRRGRLGQGAQPYRQHRAHHRDAHRPAGHRRSAAGARFRDQLCRPQPGDTLQAAPRAIGWRSCRRCWPPVPIRRLRDRDVTPLIAAVYEGIMDTANC